MKKRLIKKLIIAGLLGILSLTPAVQALAVTDTAVTDAADVTDVTDATDPTDVDESEEETADKTVEADADTPVTEEPMTPADDDPADAVSGFKLTATKGVAALAGPAANDDDSDEGDEEDEEDADDAEDEEDEDEEDADITPSVSIISGDYNSDGSKITITAKLTGFSDDGVQVTLYLKGKAQTTAVAVENDTATVTVNTSATGGEYEIYFLATDVSGGITESNHVFAKKVSRNLRKTELLVTDTADGQATGSIEYVGDIAGPLYYYKEGNSQNEIPVENKLVTGLAKGTYYFIAPGYADGYTYYSRTSVSATVKSGGSVQYVVRTSGDDNVKFNRTVQVVKEGNDASVSVEPVNDKTHYIDADSIRVEPEESYDSFSLYSPTGELTITNVKGDITVSASSVKKQTVSKLTVESVAFNEKGIYSEANPGIKTIFEVKAVDENGEPAPAVTIYYKEDERAVSYTQKKETDQDGIAHFEKTYEISKEINADRADFKPVFALDNEFKIIPVSTDIHLVLQSNEDLVLYTDQVIGTVSGGKDGKVINVPANYELWTGEVHQNAIDWVNGEWIHPDENGAFTGLSAGQHVIRAGEKRGADGTFYFASDYDYFFVPRGIYTVSTDIEASENVEFTGDTTQAAEPGGTVYIYVNPKQGYEISEISVNKPNYVSNGVRYSAENGYVIIDGISGSLTLTVKAVKTAAQTDPAESAPGSEDSQGVSPGTSSGTTSGSSSGTLSGATPGSSEAFPASIVASPSGGTSAPVAGSTPQPLVSPAPVTNTPAQNSGQASISADAPAVLPAYRERLDSNTDTDAVTASPQTISSDDAHAADDDSSRISDDPTAKAGLLPVTAGGSDVEENILATPVIWFFIIAGLVALAALYGIRELYKGRKRR